MKTSYYSDLLHPRKGNHERKKEGAKKIKEMPKGLEKKTRAFGPKFTFSCGFLAFPCLTPFSSLSPSGARPPLWFGADLQYIRRFREKP